MEALSMTQRKRIAYGEKIEVSFSARDAELVRDHTLADPEYVERLKPSPGGCLVGKFTLDDLDDLLGYIAAEANHAKSKRLQKELDGLYGRLQSLMNAYDDGA
jgi:hypothetical protein